MSRISDKFNDLRQRGQKGFIPFVTVGDPDLETSQEIVLTLAEHGADVIELGVPFSDPMADGPTIQASSQRALENNISVVDVLSLTSHIRSRTHVPIVLFSYLNPLLQYGPTRLARDAASAGVDGVLVTDVIDDEAIDMGSLFRSAGLDMISLVAPTTSDERLEKIAGSASGFIYAVSRAGVTGAQDKTSGSAEHLVRRTRKFTDLPIAVGFGISSRGQIEEVWRYADSAVVGSAIVAEIGRSGSHSDLPKRIGEFVDQLIPARRVSAAEKI